MSAAVLAIVFSSGRVSAQRIDDFNGGGSSWTIVSNPGGNLTINSGNTAGALEGSHDLVFNKPSFLYLGPTDLGKIASGTFLRVPDGSSTHIGFRASRHASIPYSITLTLYDDDNADSLFNTAQDDVFLRSTSALVTAGSGVVEFHLPLASGWTDQNGGGNGTLDLAPAGLLRVEMGLRTENLITLLATLNQHIDMVAFSNGVLLPVELSGFSLE